MDDTDVEILRILGREGRASLQAIADRVRLRRPSVHARVRKLEERGIVQSYRAVLDPEQTGCGLVAFASIRVLRQRNESCSSACGTVSDALRRIPEVVEVHTVAGDDDLLVKLRAADVRDLERVLMREVSAVPGVERVRTTVALSTHFERENPVLPRRRVKRAAKKA